MTYNDVCKKLFNCEKYYTDASGEIRLSNTSNIIQYETDPNNATTKHQLVCIMAKNMLANVAKYLNDGWKPDRCSYKYCINNYYGNLVVYSTKGECSICLGQSIFKTKELAQQAIEILGEETVKLALEPLGIWT